MSNVGDGNEARRAESVQGVGTSGVGEAGGEGSSAELVGGLAIVDL